MIFHSLDYALFLTAFVALYWALPQRGQIWLLLLASYVFYGWVHPWYVILLAASSVADYAYALGMQRFPARKRLLLACSISTNLGLLCFFKYFDFFVDNALWAAARAGLDWSRPTLQVLLPVGISFYTFQSLSYTIDVYRGRIEPRRDFIGFAAFLAMFPQLVAGPIERASNVLPQLERPRRFDPDRVRTALLLICWGLFKKLVIADNVAAVADKVFLLSSPSFALLWTGTLGFALQIYVDFSAYSDIARGSARLLGIELMKNFDHPYLAASPAEFWSRWHISLSTWFRDYVYIPLGGNRGSAARTARNLLLTFLLSGFWHGASWNFVLWGAYHGLLLIAQRQLERGWPALFALRWLRPLRVAGTFTLVTAGWLLFRETNFDQLVRDLALRPGADTPAQWMAAGHLLGLILLYAAPLVVDSVCYLSGVYDRVRDTTPWALAQGAAATVLIAGLVLFYSEMPSDFIYFQF